MEELPEEEKPGIPAWVVTFADLMSLLMCFFVLLLSFSEIDAAKFKQIAGELSKAFGVQREVPALEIPMGTSPVFDKFSPGRPEPTPLDEVRQTTTEQAPNIETNNAQATIDSQISSLVDAQVRADKARLEKVLAGEIASGRIQLLQDEKRIIIRVAERGSFRSGSAKLTYEFEGVLIRLADVFRKIPGQISVEGHTDSVPVTGGHFATNWDLSATRAATVANALLEVSGIDPTRLVVKGYAATHPIAGNETAEERAKNRRVEIIVDLSESLAGQAEQWRARLQKSRDEGRKPAQSGQSDTAQAPASSRDGVDIISW